jgi:hypothetical protein
VRPRSAVLKEMPLDPCQAAEREATVPDLRVDADCPTAGCPGADVIVDIALGRIDSSAQADRDDRRRYRTSSRAEEPR